MNLQGLQAPANSPAWFMAWVEALRVILLRLAYPPGPSRLARYSTAGDLPPAGEHPHATAICDDVGLVWSDASNWHRADTGATV